jgi:thiamine-monophosphate kinase
MISETDIISQYLKKLNFRKKETFNFENDGALLKQKTNMDIVVTNDAITETVDFFKNDDPESIAQKIMTYNLSDLSSLGAVPYAYTLSLSLPAGINKNWLIKFTNKLHFLQKKFNIFLLGGDIGTTNQIHISSNFFGYVKKNLVIKRQSPKLGDSIWVTGNIGESYIGLLVKQKKIHIKPKLQKYFTNKYLFPLPCMIGSSIINSTNCAIDISDGFLGDLSKLLNKKLGADLLFPKIPFSKNTKFLIDQKAIDPITLLNGGDDYQLIFISHKKNDSKINSIAKKLNYSVSKVGKIINKDGIFIDGNKINDTKNSFQYFF